MVAVGRGRDGERCLDPTIFFEAIFDDHVVFCNCSKEEKFTALKLSGLRGFYRRKLGEVLGVGQPLFHLSEGSVKVHDSVPCNRTALVVMTVLERNAHFKGFV